MNIAAPPGRTAAEVACWAAWLNVTRTDPMCLKEVADAFGVDRSNASALLAGIAGVRTVTVGSQTRYRVPLAEMPPAYVARELLSAGVSPKLAVSA